MLSGDAAARGLALAIGIIGMGLAMPSGILLLLNVLRGSSGDGGGVPTVIGLELIRFAVQKMMFAVLSRQAEAIRLGSIRRRVHFRRLGNAL